MQQLLAGQVLGTGGPDFGQRVHQLQRWYIHIKRGAFRMFDMWYRYNFDRGIIGMRGVLTRGEARGYDLRRVQ